MTSATLVEPDIRSSAVLWEYLTFTLGSETYGIAIGGVQEIRRFSAATHMAGAPAHVLGVISVRGDMVPVVDLRLRLGIDAPINASTSIIIVSVNDRPIGVVVDAVCGVEAVRGDQIRPMPTLGNADTGHVIGLVTTASNGLLILVDAKPLLALA